METILILCQNSNIGEEEQKILAFESLKPSHHPLIGIKTNKLYIFFYLIVFTSCIFLCYYFIYL